MLKMKRSIPKKELHKIAKNIQWCFKSGLSKMYRKAFSYTKSITRYDSEKRYKLRLAIEDSLAPSSKLHDSSTVKEVLKSCGLFEDYDEFRYISFLAGFKLPSLDIITSDLNSIINSFEGINFQNDQLSVEMGPFELEGVNFGNFIATFNMNDFCILGNEVYPYITPVTPNYPEGDDEHSHPHVRGSDICLGQGHSPLDAAALEGRLQDCFEIIRSILNTYNANDPFAPIVKWTGNRCPNCGDFFEVEYESAMCNICETTYCENCVRQCCSASDFACYKCIPAKFLCRYCGRSMCAECVRICEECGHRLCFNHIEKGHHRCVY